MPLLAFDTWVELRRSVGRAEAWAVVDTPERAHRGGSWLFSRAHGALEVRVFGPRARGDAKEDSDLDLLVNLAGGRSLFDLVAIKQDLEECLGVRVDVVIPASVSPYMRETVLSEAVALG